MGKSEILMLLAGVALSIMLAMIAVPMFSSGNEMADRQQVQQDLMSIKSSIPLILALEGDEYDGGTPSVGKFTHTNIKKHVTGFDVSGTELINSNPNSKKTTYVITDDEPTAPNPSIISVAIDSSVSKVDLSRLSRMENICDKNTPAEIADLANSITPIYTFSCKMSR